MEASTLKSLFIIFFIVFCTTQAISAQTCQEALSPKKVVVSGSPPKIPLPIEDGLSESKRQFRTAYNKGEFVGDERYVSLFYSTKGAYITRFNARITGLENGYLILDIIDQTGSIISWQLPYNPDSVLNLFNFYEVSEESKDIFHRIEQTPPLTEVNFDSKNKEKLKEDKIDRAIFIGNQLRNSPILNPYKTHIVDFEDQITDHVEYIKQGILSSGTDVNSRLTILDAFKHEAESKRDNKELTYQYWLLWNMRLSILASSEQPTSWNWHTHEDTLSRKLETPSPLSEGYAFNDYTQDMINVLLELFPSFILLPVIEPLGYKDFNKMTPHGVFPIELGNKDVIQDNRKMSPYKMYGHDVNHAVLSTHKRIDLPNMGNSQFSKRYLQIAETFPDKIRKMAGIGFFIFFHETTEILRHGSNIKEFFEKHIFVINKEDTLYTRLRNKENDLGSILPEDVQSDKEIKEYFEQVIDAFSTIYSKIARDVIENP